MDNHRVYNTIKIAVILLAMMFLSSCTQEVNPTTSACSDDEVLSNGQCVSSELLELKNEVNANYIFDEELEIDNESQVIDEVEVIVDKLIYKGLAENEQITYKLTDKDENYFDEVYKLIYINEGNIQSFETVLHSLFSLYESYANYGLIYGLATSISIELGYIEEDEWSTEEVIRYFLHEDRDDLMDLTYPTFSESYTGKRVINFVKQFSNHFTRFIIKNYDIQKINNLLLISDYDEFESEYKLLVNEFIMANGLEYEVSTNKHPIFFDRNPRNYYSVWYTKHAKYFLHESFRKVSIDFRYFGNFLMSNYQELKENIYRFEDDMYEKDALFKDDSVDYQDLKVFIEYSDRGYSLYTSGAIYLCTITALSHEYIHFLTFPYTKFSGNNEWLSETVAHYYGRDFYYYDKYYEHQYLGRSDNSVNSPTMSDAAQMFREIYNREIEYSKDRYELNDIYIYLMGDYSGVYEVYDFGRSGLQYTSMVHYFIETYGEEIYFKAFTDSSLINELTNKTWPEIIRDWEIYIKSKYD